MALAGSLATKQLYTLFTAPAGIPGALSAIGYLDGVQTSPITAGQIVVGNAPPDIVEKSTATRYPAVRLYCSKEINSLGEKFRTFSGTAEMVIEIRISQDRLDGIETASQMYADAATRVLDLNRGNWGSGMFYAGGYEVSYGPVKHGGRNFIQITKIGFTVNISVS